MRKFAALVLAFVFSATIFGQIKKPEPPLVKPPFSASLQTVVVTIDGQNTASGQARLFQRSSSGSGWKEVGKEFPVVIGSKGLAWSKESVVDSSMPAKVEGDARSPAGLFPLTFAFGRSDKPAEILLPYSKLAEYSECVDDVGSNHYNRLVDRLKVGNFDWKTSEKMLDVGMEYELGVFVAHNSYPVRKGDGSCIFLHIWKDASSGTAGCTAMRRDDLMRILTWADPKKSPYLVQLTETDYKKYRKSWNLPKL